MSAWVAIDFETANEFRGSPCAVALVAVRDGIVVDQLVTYIQPPPSRSSFSPFNMSIHGISPAMVAGAPTWPEALAAILRFVDGRTLVAHNAAFDVGVIRDACTETGVAWPTLSYGCTLVVARRTWQLLSYSLPWVAAAANHELLDHHNPAADAYAAAAIMKAALVVHGKTSVPDTLAGLRIQLGEVSSVAWTGCHHLGESRAKSALPGANLGADPDGPLFGLRVCFTGTLGSMPRRQAWELVAEAGGQPVPSVTKDTDLLVAGEQDPRRLVPGATLSGKQQKAAALLATGHSIELIAEPDFLQRLASTEGLSLRLDQHG
jgi:DNA polymerase-3 subunit epsilon